MHLYLITATSSQMVCNDNYAHNKATCTPTSIADQVGGASSLATSSGRLWEGSNCKNPDDPGCLPYTVFLSAFYSPILECSGPISCNHVATPLVAPVPEPWAPHTATSLFGTRFTFDNFPSGTPTTITPYVPDGPWTWHPASPFPWSGGINPLFGMVSRNESNQTTLSHGSPSAVNFSAPVFNTLTGINQPAQTSHTLVPSDLTHPARSVELEERVNKPVSYSEAVCKGAEVLAMVKAGTTSSTFTDYSTLNSGGYQLAALDPIDGALDAVLSKQGINVPKNNLQPWRRTVS